MKLSTSGRDKDNEMLIYDRLLATVKEEKENY